MSSAGPSQQLPCGGAHIFSRFRRWPRRLRWRCVYCGFVTRHYDSVDAAANRPIHAHMSVAVKGFNADGGSRA